MTLEQIETIRNHLERLGCTEAQVAKHLGSYKEQAPTRRRLTGARNRPAVYGKRPGGADV
jgi:hypothetical protein